jgi:hypothetical protein
VARCRVKVDHAVATRDCYRDAPDDRVWRARVVDRDLWCIIDAPSQRTLLEFILAGPGSPSPTAVERAIVAESVSRLFDLESPQERFAFREERSLRPPVASMWRSNVDLSDASGRCATLQLFATIVEAPLPPQAPVAVDVADIPLAVISALEPIGVRLAELVEWEAGAVIPLDKSMDRLRVTMSAGPAMLAIGVLGSVGTKRAIRVSSLACVQAL